MQMQLGSDTQIRDGLLAENTLLSEKPRLGFGRTETTVHQASIRLNYLNGNRVSSTVVFEGRPVSLMAQQPGTPAALTVKSVDVLDTTGQNGINVAVTYQIVDASGNPVKGKHMLPTEHVDEKQQKSGTPIPLSCTGFCPIGPTAVPGTSKYAGKDGTFKDAPVGSTFESGGGAVVATQQIHIRIGNTDYAVRTNVFTITSGSGSGSISNGSDINAHTP